MKNIDRFNDFTWLKNDDGTVTLKDARGLVKDDPTVIDIPESILCEGQQVNVTGLFHKSFILCPYIKKIIIPQYLSNIPQDMCLAAQCPDLEEIIVDERNNTYTSKGGALYTKGLTGLIAFPPTRTDYESILESAYNVNKNAFGDIDLKLLPKRFREDYESQNFEFDDKTMTATLSSPIYLGLYIDEQKVVRFPSIVELAENRYDFKTINWLELNYKNYDYDVVKNIILPDSVEEINAGAFMYYEKVIMNIPARLKRIGENAFLPIETNDLTLPSTLEFIGLHAFNKFAEVKHITIPRGVEDASFIYDYTDLEDIELCDSDNGHETLTIVDGVLYTADMKILLKYPVGKKDTVFHIPEGVEKIMTAAFVNNKYVQKVVMSDSVIDIKRIECEEIVANNQHMKFFDEEEDGLSEYYWSLFEGCDSLKEVVLSNNIKYITPDLVINERKELYIPKCAVYVGDYKKKYSEYKKITIEEGNEIYFKHEECIYEGCHLIYVPEEYEKEELHIMDGCRSVSCLSNEHIKKLHLPKSVNSFTDMRLTSLEEVTVDKGNEHFMAIDGMLYHICKTTDSIIQACLCFIPEAKNIETLRINASDSYGVHLKNKYLKKLIIGKSFTKDDLSLDLPSLESIEVEYGNENFMVINGCLLSRRYQSNDFERIIYAPEDKKSWIELFIEEKKQAKRRDSMKPEIPDTSIQLDGKYFICEPYGMLIRKEDDGTVYAKSLQYGVRSWLEKYINEDTGDVETITRSETQIELSDEFELDNDSIFAINYKHAIEQIKLIPITQYLYETCAYSELFEYEGWLRLYEDKWNIEVIGRRANMEFKELVKMGYKYQGLYIDEN